MVWTRRLISIKDTGLSGCCRSGFISFDGEDRALRGDAIDVRGRMAEVLATHISPEVAPAGVVGHENDNVGSAVGALRLRHSAPACEKTRHGKHSQCTHFRIFALKSIAFFSQGSSP